jgi:hypothetical protein
MDRYTAQHIETIGTDMAEEQGGNKSMGQGPFYEVIEAEELAKRWKVPASWIRERIVLNRSEL